MMVAAEVDAVLTGILATSVKIDTTGLEGNEPFGLQVMGEDGNMFWSKDGNELKAEAHTKWSAAPTWTNNKGQKSQDDGGTGPGDENSFKLA